MQPPMRFLVGAGCLLAVLAGKKLRRSGRGQVDRLDHRIALDLQNQSAKEVVHAYASSPSSVSQQGCPQTVATGYDGPVWMVSLSLVLMLITTVAAAWRRQWDLLSSSAVACAFMVLNQVLKCTSGSSWYPFSNRSLPEADDAAVVLEEPEPAKKLQDLAGVWIKDSAACDSLEAAMDLLHLNGLIRTGAKLIKGVKITLNDERFNFAVFSVISWFKITESYLLNGSVSYTRRRDFRRGKAQGAVTVTPWGTLRLAYEWNEPVGGTGIDEFLIDTQGRLNIVTTVAVDGRQESYTLRYRRK